MKKSSKIKLLCVVASVLATHCSEKHEKVMHNRLYIRADTNISYSTFHPTPMMPYIYFIPFGMYHNNGYVRTGYYNSRTYAASVSANSPIARGGMGNIGRSGSRSIGS